MKQTWSLSEFTWCPKLPGFTLYLLIVTVPIRIIPKILVKASNMHDPVKKKIFN